MGTINKIKNTGTEETKKECFQPLQLLTRDDYLVSSILSCLTFVVYAFTAAPGVTLGDSGDFINGVLTLGIVHPPGYPLYTVLGHLFSLLPFGEPAFRVNLFSALWGSLCLGVMFLILSILSIARTHAVFASLFLGFTTVFWSKTAVAEVYSFNAFLLASIVFWIFSYNRDKKRSQLYLIFLTTGLALSNHYPLVILTGIGLVFLLDRRDLHTGEFFKGLLFLGLGLTPYLYLFIQALNPDLEYNFGKNSDFSMVLDHILRRYYINEYGGTVSDKPLLAFTLLQAIITNFLLASVILVFGVTVSFLDHWRYRYPLLIAALAPSVGLMFILSFPSDEDYSALFLDYLMPSFLLFSFFLAIGLQRLMNHYVKNTVGQLSLLVILFLTQAGFNFQTSSHHNDKVAEVWASELLNSLEPSSLLILCSPLPASFFAIYYVHLIKGIRPDVTLYDRLSWWTNSSLYGPEILFTRRDAVEYRKRREYQLINNSSRAIYYTCKNPIDEQKISFSRTPFVYRVDKRHSKAADLSSFRLGDGLLDSLVNDYPRVEHRLDNARKAIFSRLITYYGGHNLPEVKRIRSSFTKTKLYSNPKILLPLANNLYYFENYALARAFYERAEELSLQAFSPTDLAVFCSLLANAEDYDKALGICMRQEESSAPCEINTVKTQQTIAGISKEKGDWPKVAEYSRKILHCQPDHKVARGYLKLATERSR